MKKIIISLVFIINLIHNLIYSVCSPLVLTHIKTEKTTIKSYYFTQNNMPASHIITLEQGDILKKTTQAIVNAANEAIWMPNLGGIAQAIIGAAGNDKIKKYVFEHFPTTNNIRCKTGQACTTPAFNLEKNGVKNIIHAVGPFCGNACRPMTPKERTLLENAYTNSLKEADKHKLTSIAFPFISSAIFVCNKNDASEIPLKVVKKYWEKYPTSTIKNIDFVLFGNDDFTLFLKQAESIYHP